jgi:hypothetical protein
MCQKGVTLQTTAPCLDRGATEGVNRRAGLDINEPALLEHTLRACARQVTGNSIGPQVDIAERSRRNRLSVRNVRKLATPTWFQHAHDFSEDLHSEPVRPATIFAARRFHAKIPTRSHPAP